MENLALYTLEIPICPPSLNTFIFMTFLHNFKLLKKLIEFLIYRIVDIRLNKITPF